MKTIATLIMTAGLLAAPAFAEKVTIEFAPSSGEKVITILDTASNTATMGEKTMPYTFDEATNTLCAQMEEELCATFEGEAQEPVAGQTAAYTATNGSSGTATVISVE